MNRRSFIKRISATVACLAVPFKIEAERAPYPIDKLDLKVLPFKENPMWKFKEGDIFTIDGVFKPGSKELKTFTVINETNT